MGKSEKSRAGWYFLLGVIVLSGIIFLLKPESFILVMGFFWNLIKKIVLVLVLVFGIIFITNYLVTPKKIVWFFGREAKKKGWVIAIVSGIISTGPIYLWYPLLSDLKDKGARTAYLATFLYNRAVKPALIPLLVVYFGWKFTIVLTGVMVVASVCQGLIVEKTLEVLK